LTPCDEVSWVVAQLEIGPRRPTEVEQLAKHIRALSDELAAEREARRKAEKKGYSVLDLHVPLGVVFALLVGILAPATFVIRNFYVMKGHVENTYVHADEKAVVEQGGIAYNKPIHDAELSAHGDLEARDRRAVRVLRDAKWDAKAQKLRFKDPEFEPLRP
jgi:uncharacterized iron-regulated membrane protein